MIDLDPLNEADVVELHFMAQHHFDLTGSTVARAHFKMSHDTMAQF